MLLVVPVLNVVYTLATTLNCPKYDEVINCALVFVPQTYDIPLWRYIAFCTHPSNEFVTK